MKQPDNIDSSEFNEAISFLSRVNTIFYSLLIARNSKDLFSWCNELNNLYLALCNDMDKKEKETKKLKLRFIMDRVNNLTIKSNRSGSNVIPQDLYWELFDFEEYLRMVYNRAGYQTKRKDDFLK